MALFSTIGSVMGNIFGTQAAGDRLLDSISKAGDKMFFTEEEKAEYNERARTEGMNVFMKWLESTTGSRLARRMIAFITIGTWAMEHWMALVFNCIAVFDSSAVVLDGELQLNRFSQVAQILTDTANDNRELVMVVMLFYFGGPAAIDGVKALGMRWANRGQRPDDNKADGSK